jgi:hypothetical protein
MKFCRIAGAGLVLTATTLLLPVAAQAQARMEFIPSMSLFASYDDNLFARANGAGGQMFTFRPTFEGNYESARLRLLGLYSFDAQRSNFSSLNTLDARRHLLGQTQYRPSPLTTLTTAVRYDRSETPGEISIDTGILGDRRTAERVQVTPSFARRFGQKMVATGGYDFTTEHLIDGERGTLHVGRLGLGRDITTRSSVNATYIGRQFSDDFDSHNSHGALLGWTYETGPGTRFSVSGGPKVTSYHGLTPEASVAYLRETPHVRVGLDYWHGETIVLGIRGPVRVDNGTARVSWPLTRYIEIGTHAAVSDITTIDLLESRNYRGTLVGSWTPGGMYTVATSYGIDYQLGDIRPQSNADGDLIFDDRVLRHVFRVSVTVAPRFRRSILPPEEAARVRGVSR